MGTLSKTDQMGQKGAVAHPPSPWQACTSVGMLGAEPVKPFSAMVLCELLGELGPEPGALLHTDDTTGQVAVTWACLEPYPPPPPQFPGPPPNRNRRGALTPRPGTRDLNSSLLKGANDSAILATQEGTASPLGHLLL